MTVKFEDLRVGDRVTLKQATVLSIGSDGYIKIKIDGHVDRIGDREENSIYASAIASIESRLLKVGKARFRNNLQAVTVLSIHKTLAWVERPNGYVSNEAVISLENIGEDAP